MSDIERLLLCAERLENTYGSHVLDQIAKELRELAARQAPASGEVEPVAFRFGKDQKYIANHWPPENLKDKTVQPLYTHTSAKVPEGITGEMLNKVWKAGFDAENIDDREYCQELIILRNAVEDATPTPATTPETECDDDEEVMECYYCGEEFCDCDIL